tara:strand:- start:42 stop:686 length:645 start_codon:yes stop_codon:yes gene_type:complete
MTFNLASKADELKKAANEKFEELVGGSSKFIPQIKLMNAMSGDLKKTTESFNPRQGDFVWNNQVLGSRFHAVSIGYRPKAIRFNNGEVEMLSYDMESADFKTIQGSNDSNDRVGPEFLLWLPEVQGFGVYHFTKTARNNAGVFKTMAGSPMEVYSEEVSSKNFSWFTIRGRAATFEINAENSPSEDLYNSVTEMFNNPKVNTEEKADAAPSRTR